MGAYMSEPVTDTCSDSGSNGIITYGASAMQGWRTNQEDAHNAILDFDSDSCLFAVYDGHGGAEVSDYTARKFPDFLKAMDLWKEGKIGEALAAAFIQFDEHLTKEEVIDEIRRMAGIPKKEEQTDGDTHEEKAMLFEEACLPIGEVLKKYGLILGHPDDYDQSPTCNLRKKKRIHNKSDLKAVENNDKTGCDTNPSVAEDKENVSNEGEETAKVGDNHIEAGKRPKAKKNGENPNSAEDSDSKDSNTGMPEFKRPRKDESPVRKSLDLDCKKQSANIANDIPSPTVNNSTSPNGVIQNGEHQHNAGNGGAGERHLELIQTLVSECETVVMGRSPVRNHPIKSREAEDAGSNQLTKESPATERMHTKSESLNEEETVFKSETSSWTSLINLNEVGRQTNQEPKGKTKGEKCPKEKTEVEESEESSDDPEYNEAEADDSSDLTGNSEEVEEEEEEESGEEDEESSDEDEDGDDEADEEMFPVPTGDTPGVDSGTTACVVVVKGKTLYVANAGDSRIVLCRNGQAMDLSVDHKPEDQIEKDRIENAGGKITADGRVNGGLNLSRAIGDHFYKQNKKLPLESQMISAMPDIRVEELKTEDSFLVLACDGIWNSLTSQEVVDFVKEKLGESIEPSKICELLCERCLAPSTIGDGTGCDNMTAIVVDLSKLVST